MRFDFHVVSDMQYKIRALQHEVEAFRSGEKYIAMEEALRKMQDKYEHEIAALKKKILALERQGQNIWNYAYQTMEDYKKECDNEVAEALKQRDRAFEKAEEWERKYYAEYNAKKQALAEKYEALTTVEDQKEIIKKQKATINLNSENSSLTTAQDRKKKKKIPNSREKTGRKPGAQVGHEGHSAAIQDPTFVVEIPAPPEILENPDYYATGKTIRKQVVDIKILMNVTEYVTEEYRSRSTGTRVHAPFPEGVVNRVNYGGSVKALAFLLTLRQCTSIRKAQELISEITNGKLNLSVGTISGLASEFADRTEEQRAETYKNLMLSPVMHTDATSVKLNGSQKNAFVCSDPDGKNVLYFYREKKGHEGVKGTPVEDYVGILVHDHDKTFYSYGTDHQECIAHILRYLQGQIEYETNLEWGKEMKELVREMVHYTKELDPDSAVDEVKVAEFEKRYDAILKKAEEEYADEPPSKYYRDGYNLYKRLVEYKDNTLLFLHDKRVPHTNTIAERMIRELKRLQHKVIVFRSEEGIESVCDCLGTLAQFRLAGDNQFQKAAEIFS